MSVPAHAVHKPSPAEARPKRLHLPDLPAGSVLGCAQGRLHHVFWCWSDAAGGRYLCRCCHAWAVRRYVVFAEGKQPRGGTICNGNARAV